MDSSFDAYSDLDEYYVQALLLAQVVKRILNKKAEINLSDQPLLELKPISEFMKRMRVSSIEKFNDTTYISTINFYRSKEEYAQGSAVGAIVLYISEDYVVKLFERLGYPYIDEDDEEALEDASGTLCNLIAGNFKNGLTQLGYKELVMSHFSSFQNDILNGVDIDQKQKQKYEICFEVDGVKRIFVDLVLGKIERMAKNT